MGRASHYTGQALFKEHGTPDMMHIDQGGQAHGLYLWVIIGSSIGGVAVIITVIALWIYLRRRASKLHALPEIPAVPGHELCPYRVVPPSSYTSSGSEEVGEWSHLGMPQGPHRPRLMHAATLDVPSGMRLESVQPVGRPVLTRWNSVSTSYPGGGTIGTVQPDLYKGSDDEEPHGPPCPNGRLWFSILYKDEDEQFEITVIKAKYIPGRGLSNSPRDPYVRAYLLPDEENYQQTKVKKRTLSPKYHEQLIFKIGPAELRQRTLRLSMYDVDRRKVRHSLGHVMVPLAKADLTTNEVVWKDFMNAPKTTTNNGEIQLSLACNPFTNRVRATVARVKKITGIESGEAGLYTKVQLYHGRKVMKTKRTALQKMTPTSEEVVFNETFTFGISGRYFDSCSLTFTVVVAGQSPLVKDKPLGRVVLGPFMYARGEELLHWQEMLTNPRSSVTHWHGLEPVSANALEGEN